MKLGFIGTGKIASAVITGICTSDLDDIEIVVSPRNAEKSKYLSEKFEKVNRMGSNQQVLDHAGIIFIALIPHLAKNILEPLRFSEKHIVISLIPYIRLSELSEILHPVRSISRATPLPTVVNHNCPIQVFKPNKTTEKIFSRIGQTLTVESEDQLHAIWTLTGLIAPCYQLMGELSSWAASRGVDKRVSDRYVADMFMALADAACRSSEIDYAGLIAHASTPGGMNEQAGQEVSRQGAHAAWSTAAENLLSRFPD